MNDYEEGLQKCIPAVLIYAFCGSELLLIKKYVMNKDLWNGLGGKCEKAESYFVAARREFKEESGLDLEESRFKALGFIQFPNFKAHRNEDWNVMVFRCELTSEEKEKVPLKTQEGELYFVKVSEILNKDHQKQKYPMWPGDELFLSKVCKNESFLGVIEYAQGVVVKGQMTG